jgi:hypothetical protein
MRSAAQQPHLGHVARRQKRELNALANIVRHAHCAKIELVQGAPDNQAKKLDRTALHLML